jgi:amidase
VKKVAKELEAMGHHVELARVTMGGINIMEVLRDLFFFDFDNRINGYAARTGRKPSPETLEPVIWSVYQRAKEITSSRFMAAWSQANMLRRHLGAFYSKYDLWLSPTTARTAEPWGEFNLSKPGADFDSLAGSLFGYVTQYTIPHNLMGTPAISMPLVMHSNGLPIGIQLAGRPSEDHVVLQAAYQLEKAMPWAKRIPPLHVSR